MIVFEERMLRRIFGSKRVRKLQKIARSAS
jgi:hypothetical protein